MPRDRQHNPDRNVNAARIVSEPTDSRSLLGRDGAFHALL
jgi:hypothetical protein